LLQQRRPAQQQQQVPQQQQQQQQQPIKQDMQKRLQESSAQLLSCTISNIPRFQTWVLALLQRLPAY
jgi:hypothetical protein